MYERPDGRPAANPLGLSLGFFEGEAFVTLRERTIADGVVIRALDLAVAELNFPFDLDGDGAEAFQSRSTRLKGLVLDVDLTKVGAALEPALASTPFSGLRMTVEGHRIVVEARVAADADPASPSDRSAPADYAGRSDHLAAADHADRSGPANGAGPADDGSTDVARRVVSTASGRVDRSDPTGRADLGDLEDTADLVERDLTAAPSSDPRSVEAALGRALGGTPVLAEVVVGPGPHRVLRGYMAPPVVVGYSSVPPRRLTTALIDAVEAALTRAGPQAARTLKRVGSGGMSLDVVDALMWAVLPANGWKVPEHEDVPLRGVTVTASGVVRIVVGEVPDLDRAHEPEAKVQSALQAQVTGALVREETAGLAAIADDDLDDIRADSVFRHLTADLDPHNEAQVGLTLGIGASRPNLHPELADLAEGLLDADGGVAGRGYLALAAIDRFDGRDAGARARFAAAARSLRGAQMRRLAGLVLREAATGAPLDERARLLEEAIAMRPDDADALAGLVDALPALGRSLAAIRAARRLAHVCEQPQQQAQAHVTAGTLLLDDVGDRPQARREFERALKVAPAYPDALEGLARAAAADGQPEEATQILEGLVARAEADGQPEQAAAILLRLGDLWRSTDPAVALQRYQQARERAPDRVGPLASIAAAAQQLGRFDLEKEVVDQALERLPAAEIDEPAAVLSLRRAAARHAEDVSTEQAVEHLQEALRLAPDDVETMQALAGLHARRGEHDAYARTLGLQAQQAVADERYDAAAELFRAQMAANEDDPAQLRQVRADVAAALQTSPGHRGLLEVLIDASSTPDERLEAIDRRMVLDEPPDVRAQLLTDLAEAFEAAGRPSDAARAYEEAVETGGATERAMQALLRLYRSKGDVERLALVLARAAASASTPEAKAAALAERAEMLARVGRDADAYAAVRGVLEIDGGQRSMLALATRLALRLGQLDEARDYAEARLRLENGSDPAPALAALIDRADVAEKQRDVDAAIDSLSVARTLVDRGGAEDRQIAARLAKALAKAQRFEALAELERERALIVSSPPGERAERLLEAARIALRLGHDAQAAHDVEDALGQLGHGSADASLRVAALALSEQLAERRGDPEALAEVLGRRASLVVAAEEKTRLRLEQAEVLEDGGRIDGAVQALKHALHEQPDALELAERLGQAALRAEQHLVAAEAFERAARLADTRAQPSIELHGQAAASYVVAGREDDAMNHDIAVVRAAANRRQGPWFESAIKRLEARARRDDDAVLLGDVLGRMAAGAAPEAAATALLEKAKLEAERLERPRDALDALRRARALAPEGSDIAKAVDAELSERLGALGQHAEQAVVLTERAERAEAAATKARYLLDAARVYAEALDDTESALARVNAAVRADPEHAAARTYRMSLLREADRPEALADVLVTEAAASDNPDRIAALLTEAASLLVPVEALRGDVQWDRPALEEALALVRRASGAAPRARAPLEAAVAYTQALGRADEEIVVLGQLAPCLDDEEQRLVVRLRRAMLLDAEARDFEAATDELLAAYRDIRRLTPGVAEVAVRRLSVPAQIWLEVDLHDDAVVTVLSKGLALTRRIEAWDRHLRMIEGLIHRAPSNEVAAELYAQAGDVFAEQMVDASEAESAYRSALMLSAEHHRARERLRSMLIAQERFMDLGDVLGARELLALRESKAAELSPAQRRRLLAAVVDYLPVDGEPRAEASLSLARLELADPEAAPLGVARLNGLLRGEPRRDEALKLLLAHFEATADPEAYCETLRTYAEARTGTEQARALLDTAAAYESRMDDPFAAERTLLAAFEADPSYEPARRALSDRWRTQDRFDELAGAMGAASVEGPMRRLIAEGLPSRNRAFRAAAAWISAHPAAERTDLWLDIADAIDAESGVEDGGLVDMLEQQLDRTSVPQARQGLLLALADRLMAQLTSAEDPDAIARPAEKFLQEALQIDPDQTDARANLRRLFEFEGRYFDIGRTLGVDVLEDVRARALARGSEPVLVRADQTPVAAEIAARRATEALVQLTAGPQQARLLLDLVAAEPVDEDVARREGLYRAALAAEPDNPEAIEGFRRLLVSTGRFREVAELLGVEVLRRTVAELENGETTEANLPAILTLIDVLREDPSAVDGLAPLWVRAGELHEAEDDVEAAEYALRMALGHEPEHDEARAKLRGLLVAQERLTELARVDPTLLSEAVDDAAAGGDEDLQVRGLRVLAEQRGGVERADLLAQVAALEWRRGRPEAAEADLTSALKAAPGHQAARANLEDLFWATGRFGQAARVLGPEAFGTRLAREMEAYPHQTAAALRTALDGLPTAARASALEALGMYVDDAAEDEVDRARRLEDLSQAKQLWESLSDPESTTRIRLALVELGRAAGDPETRLGHLEEAVDHAPTAVDRNRLLLEQAELLVELDPKRALVVARRVLADVEADGGDRDRAAMLLIERLAAEGSVRSAALERLVVAEALGAPADRARWRQALARIREADGADAEVVVALLEAALLDVEDPDEALPLRRKLLALHDELGDWRSAEGHAAALAAAEDTPEQWVTLSELRMWLDDRDGAKAALERAIERKPSSRPAHESLIRMAEQEGATESVVAQLEAWAEADVDGPPRDRADRLLQAARLAVDARDAGRARQLAERAVSLVPRRDPHVETVVASAIDALTPIGVDEDRARLLALGVSALAGGRGGPLRLQLADVLTGLGRHDEASTVIEQGLHRELGENDPLVSRFIEDVGSLGPEPGARRILSAAERLGAGPVARRLRVLGAELAEAVGDKEGALTAWSRVVREVGAADEGARARAARVRISRELDDAPGLIDALIEAADDADDDAERAARLAEAAEIADLRLEEPDRAEQLLRRAIQVAEDPALLQDTLLELLRRHGRWETLDAELAQQMVGRTGPARAGLCTERAGILRHHLHDEVGAAALYVEAYESDPAPDRGAEAAWALERAGDLDAAEALLDAVLSDVPAGSHAWLRVSLAKAQSLERAGRVATAVETLRRTAAAIPDAALPTFRLRQLLVRHRRWGALADVLLNDAPFTRPVDRIRNRLAAARILVRHAHEPARAVAALRSALRIVQGWLADPQQAMPDHVVPVPESGGPPSVESTLDSPMLDLAGLAAELDEARLRVDALRLYAQSLPAGTVQQRALLLLASAEREAGDLDAAEFTLRGAVDAIHASPAAAFADRVEADRALGLLLLHRGAAEDALEALTRAEAMLKGQGQAGETARAQILVKLAQAYRAADRPQDAVSALKEARLLDEREVPDGELEEAIEAAGPSPALAELLQQRAETRDEPKERAAMLREAARVWEQLGQSERALQPLLSAYEADPGHRDEASRLQELLYWSERWADLADHLGRRLSLEPLSNADRVALLLARARLLDDPLGNREGALRLIEEAFRLQPNSVDVLDALAKQAGANGRLDIQQDALARLAAATPDPQRVVRALVDRAAVLERTGDVGLATRVLEEALERSLQLPGPSRALLDHLARLYAAQGDHASEARLWVRAASESEGAQAAAYLARAADLRRDALADRRGGLATIEAAIRVEPDQLSLRWSAIQLASSLGDVRKALAHAQQASMRAEAGGLEQARLSFQKVVARLAHEVGDAMAERLAWTRAVETGCLDAEGLDEMVNAARRSSTIAEPCQRSLAAMIDMMPSGQLRGQYRLARSHLLESPLDREDEAYAERALANEEDGVEPTALVPDDADERPDPTVRSRLERTGRWDQLAVAETARAAVQTSRPEQARVLVAAGQRLLEASHPDLIRVSRLFNEAIEVCPDLITAWACRARLDLRNGDVDGATEALQRLRDLGGAPWSPPELELSIARVAQSRGDRPAAMAAFARAKLLDPTHREAAAGLAQLAERLPSRRGARRWFDDYRVLLDETLDASALAQLCLADARQARKAQDPARALQSVGRTLKLRPTHGEARQLRLDILRDLGDSPFLLDALAAEAIDAVEPDEARELQAQAFALAGRLGDRRRGLVLASALEERADDDTDLLLALYEFYRVHEEHAGLLRIADRLGGIEALGPLPSEQRVALAKACFEAGRPAEAFTLLVSSTSPDVEDGLDSFIAELAASLDCAGLTEPADQIRLRAVLADLPLSALHFASVERALEALVAWQPEARNTRRLLAAAYQRNGVADPKAAALYRGLLAEDPGDASLLRALAAVLPDRAGTGPQAILHWINDEPVLRHPWPAVRPSAPGFFERLWTEPVRTPLGTLLRLTSSALAGVLPPNERSAALRRPAHEDPRVADVAAAVRAVVQVPLTVVVDAEAGPSVELEPGDPSTLVVGEALAEDATPAELRYHVARAAMLVELGYLLVERTLGADRRHFVAMVAAAVDDRFTEALPQNYRSGVEVVRSRLGPTERVAAEEAVAVLDLADLSFAGWIRGALQTADRFGTLMAGAPAAALSAMHRAEPRTMAESMAVREDRVRAIRQWRPLRDVVAFVVTNTYTDLVDQVGEATGSTQSASPLSGLIATNADL